MTVQQGTSILLDALMYRAGTANRAASGLQAAADKTFGLKNKSKSKVVKQCASSRPRRTNTKPLADSGKL